jgi:hypothetical protein
MDSAVLSFALGCQGHNVLPQMIEALDALGQTAALKNADLDLSHVEPTTMFRRINSPPIVARCAALPLEERPHRDLPLLRVEIVHHQADHACLRIDLIHQPADRLSEIQLGAVFGQLDAAATSQRLDKHN